MLKRLHLKNFTVFADADFEFSPGLNVIVGTNGTGKSHVLKLGYFLEMAREKIRNAKSVSSSPIDSKGELWSRRLFYDLPDLFQTSLKRLVAVNAISRIATVEAEFRTSHDGIEAVVFNIDGDSDSVRLAGGKEIANKKVEVMAPILIPAKEVLTLSWMLPASEQLVLPIEQNYLHLLRQLRLLPLRHPKAAEAVMALTDTLEGDVREEEGKYYLISVTGQKTEMNMVAEGLRKFGTLQKLLTNGSLTKNTTLYWDEPEANLNPALLRQLAAILAELARQGFQIILATHSMSLLKEFHILSRQKTDKPLPIRYFGLNAGDSQPTTVVARDDFKFLPDVVALEVELEQADDLEEIFAREDR